jgi:putative hydrolase of the HAD superfamily
LSIKNVVFDVGNVIVRWSPKEIVELSFGKSTASDELSNTIFRNDIWKRLNKGLLSEDEAASEYCQSLGWSQRECERFFYYVKATQLLIFGTVELINRIKRAGYKVYALTDNVHEIVSYLKATYNFWPLFDGATVSAEVGLLKPDLDIYKSLLSQNNLEASETVFIDDMDYNVKGAESSGIFGIEFKNVDQCAAELKKLGVKF